MQGSPAVSVVICTCHQARYFDTLETIQSLAKQSYSNIEIVLIVDRNLELLSRFQISSDINSMSNLKMGLSLLPGLSNARNKGVELASGEIIAFIDDDALADENWISSLVECYEDPKIIGAGGPMRPLWIAGFAKWIPEEFYWAIGCSYKSQKDVPHYVRSNFGSNMSFRKFVFEKVGTFDEKFGLIDSNMRTGEETEFSIRALNYFEGFKLVYTPKAVVYHKIYRFRKSIPFLIKRAYSYGSAIAHIGSSKREVDTRLQSTENSFLKYLVCVSFVEKVKNILRVKEINTNIEHLCMLLVLTAAVGIGFLCKTIDLRTDLKLKTYLNLKPDLNLKTDLNLKSGPELED